MNDNLLDHLKGRGVSTIPALLGLSREELHRLLQPFSASELYQVLLESLDILTLFGRTILFFGILQWQLKTDYLQSHRCISFFAQPFLQPRGNANRADSFFLLSECGDCCEISTTQHFQCYYCFMYCILKMRRMLGNLLFNPA